MFGKCFPFHDWTKWVAYTWLGKTKYSWQSEWDYVSEERQKRHCERCGKTQDEQI